MGILVGAVLAVLAVVAVALPFLREPAPASDTIDVLDPEALRRLELAEDRDRALTALKELEADHRAGRIADDDYRAVVGPLRRDAAEALRALDPDAPPPAVGDGAPGATVPAAAVKPEGPSGGDTTLKT